MAQFDPFKNKKIRYIPTMKAEDLFSDKMVQVFSRTTGEYLGYVYLGEDPETLQEKIEDTPEPVPETLPIPITQLKMFDR